MLGVRLGNPLEENQNKNKLKRRNMPHQLLPCSVCAKLCQYRYYNARCCESCKEFFRRTLMLNKKWTCRKSGNCGIKDFNSDCKSCRLDGCLKAGMDWRVVRMKVPIEMLQTQTYFIELEAKRQQLMRNMAMNMNMDIRNISKAI